MAPDAGSFVVSHSMRSPRLWVERALPRPTEGKDASGKKPCDACIEVSNRIDLSCNSRTPCPCICGKGFAQ